MCKLHQRLVAVSAVTAIAVLSVASQALAGEAAVKRVSATLSGAGETPKVGTPATGRIAITLDQTSGKICWTLTASGVNAAVSTDIHLAPKGKIGRSVVPLGAKYTRKGCVISPIKIVKGIISNPAAYYVNIHTKKFPEGLIAGRLHR